MEKRKILPPTYLCIYLLLCVGLHFILPIKQIIPFPYRYFGTILIIIGLWLNIWADGIFKKRKTTVNPFEESNSLVIDGPFSFSRHPMYLGMAILLLGVAIVLGSLITFVIPVAFFLTMEIVFIHVEEDAMEKAFGQEYLDYRKRVRRWI